MDISELNVLFFDTKNYLENPIIRKCMKENLKLLEGANIIILKEIDIIKYKNTLKQVKWSISHNFAHPTNEIRHYLATQYKNLLYIDADLIISKEMVDDILSEKVKNFILTWRNSKGINMSGCLFFSSNYGKGIIGDIYKLYENVPDEIQDIEFDMVDLDFLGKYIPYEKMKEELNNFKSTYVKYHFGYGKFVNFYNWDLDKVSNFYYTTKFIPITPKILDKYKVIWELIIEPDKYKYFYSMGENNMIYHVEKSFYHSPQEIISWVLLDVSYNFKKRGIPLNLINITDELTAITTN